MNLFSTAFAEETAEVAASSSFSLIDYLFIALGLYYIVCGVMTIAKKKIFDGTAKSYVKYTDESVQKAMPFVGLMDVVLGIAFIFFAVLSLELIPALTGKTALKWIGAGVLIAVALLIGCYMQFKVLKKKPGENQ